MQVTEPMTFQQIQDWSDQLSEPGRRWIADPYKGVSIAAVDDNDAIGKHELVAIGPEGGFSDDEIARAVTAGFQLLRIGPTILRVETAAIASAAIFGRGTRAVRVSAVIICRLLFHRNRFRFGIRWRILVRFFLCRKHKNAYLFAGNFVVTKR